MQIALKTCSDSKKISEDALMDELAVHAAQFETKLKRKVQEAYNDGFQDGIKAEKRRRLIREGR